MTEPDGLLADAAKMALVLETMPTAAIEDALATLGFTQIESTDHGVVARRPV